METISSIAGLLIVFLWFAVLIGLINPNWINWTKKPEKTLSRKQILIGGFLGTLILAIIGVATQPKVPQSPLQENNVTQTVTAPVSTEDKKTETQATVVSNENLGLSVEEFRKNLNTQFKKADVSYLKPLTEFDIDQGKVRDSFQVELTDEVGLVGTVNKDGLMHGLTLIMTKSDESGKPAMDLVLIATILALTVNPELDGAEAGQMILKLTKDAVEGLDNPENTHIQVIGKNKYFSLASKEMGVWIGVEPNK